MVTMNDIAVKVGVSRATVSYVLNERSTGISIREETRRRIMEMAEELGYRRNDLARAVVTGKNYVLGYLTHTPGAEVSSRIMAGAQDEADQHGYLIKQFPFVMGREYLTPVKRTIEQRLAGVLVMTFQQEALDYLHSEVSRYDMPIVLLDDSPPQPWGTHVASDSEQGLRLAVEHLVALGHRRLGFVGAQMDAPLGQERAASFRRVIQSSQLPLNQAHIVSASWDEAGVIEAGVRQILLSGPNRPTALLCAGDKIAMVALRTARGLGLQVPEDLSVVGFADLVMAAYSDPPLTTISQPFEELGEVAVTHLLAMLSHPETREDPQFQRVTVPTTLTVRSSTAPPRAS